MTYRTINARLKNVQGRTRFDAIELARIRLIARKYPRNTIGYQCYAQLIDAANKYRPSLSFRQWRAVYALAASSLR